MSSDRKYTDREIELVKAIAGKLQLVELGNKAVGKALGITIQTRPDSVGIWVVDSTRPSTEKKLPWWVKPENE